MAFDLGLVGKVVHAVWGDLLFDKNGNCLPAVASLNYFIKNTT